MKIYYKDKLIFSNIAEEEIEQTINNYIKEKKEEYEKIYKKTKELINKIEEIRAIEIGETKDEYAKFLREKHSEILKELKNIGIEIYGESFIDIFFENSENSLVGIIVYNEKNIKEKIYIAPLLLKIAIKIPNEKNFKIKEES